MNTIKATIPFSFKGKTYQPAAIIDLDALIQGEQTLDAIYQLVAKENKIDHYSYEYEVLEASPIQFSEPQGSAAKYLKDNHFDLQGFKQSMMQNTELSILQNIAKDTLGIDNLKQHEALQHALLQAYHAGKHR